MKRPFIPENVCRCMIEITTIITFTRKMQAFRLLLVLLLVAGILADTSVAFFSTSGKIKPRKSRKWSSLTQTPSVIAQVTERTSKRAMGLQIAAVALPALAVCIVEPALSLIDMYFVGRSASNSALALAAMSVNNAIFNIVAAATYPLCTGTTAMVSRCLAVSSPSATTSLQETESKLTRILTNGLFLSFALGSVLALFLHLSGPLILEGGFGLSGHARDMALTYLRTRSVALPFMLVSYVVIGFSLGVQNSWTPLVSILVSSGVNLFGDWVLCGSVGKSLGMSGLPGAALATALATFISAIVTCQQLLQSYIPYKSYATVQAYLAHLRSQIDLRAMRDFFSTSLLLFLGSCVNTLTYSAGARVASASPAGGSGMVQAAAHQVVLQCWWLVSYVSSALSLAAQSILPRLRGEEENAGSSGSAMTAEVHHMGVNGGNTSDNSRSYCDSETKSIENNHSKESIAPHACSEKILGAKCAPVGGINKNTLRRRLCNWVKTKGACKTSDGVSFGLVDMKENSAEVVVTTRGGEVTTPVVSQCAVVATKMLLGVGVGVASICTLLLHLLLLTPSLFTPDAQVHLAIKTVHVEALVSMFAICLTTVLDGIFIGYRRFYTYILASMVSTGCAWGYYMLRVLPTYRGVKGTWEGLVGFALGRLVFYALAGLGAMKYAF